MPSSLPRFPILGIDVTALSFESALSLILNAVQKPRFTGYITVTGVHGVMESYRSKEIQHYHHCSYLTVPDGMPLVWLGRWQNFLKLERVNGPCLMPEIIRQGCQKGLRHFFFGGAKGTVEKLKKNIISQFPQANIVGIETPPFRQLNEKEELDLLKKINETKPHCIWVGLSTPKQEKFMYHFLNKYASQFALHNQGILFFGVGAAFDIHAGLISQAPQWISSMGMEWLFRLCCEPRRLWRRYVFNNFHFLFLLSLQILALKRFK